MRFGEEVLSGDDSVMLLLSQIENLDDYSWVEVIRLSDGSTEIRLTGRAAFSKQLRLKTNGEITGDIPRHVRYMSGYTIPLYMIVDREKPVYPDFVFFK